jgi:uncharacterized protein (DUF1778 family)
MGTLRKSVARPKKKSSERKEASVRVRLTDEQKELIEAVAVLEKVDAIEKARAKG